MRCQSANIYKIPNLSKTNLSFNIIETTIIYARKLL